MSLCLCHSQKAFSECCEPLLTGEQQATSPEALMRSRYSAFCQKNLKYVMDTTDPQARAEMDPEGTAEWMNGAEFTKLEVLKSSQEGNKGMVEFKAHYRMNGVDEIHHEISKFRKQAGVWYFRDGKVMPPPPA